jgi:tRNA threonylcarbamoyladenosine biosynthesis protein TsaE
MAWITHPRILETRQLHWPDEAACQAFAKQLAAAPGLWPDTLIALDGPLGAGKTTFARHLLRSLGVQGRIKSPTYAVMEAYDVAEPPQATVSHFDFYRFDDAHEWVDAGFRDVFASPGLKLMEWPEKAAAFLPTPDLLLTLEPDATSDTASDTARQVTVHALTEHGRRLLRSLQ